MKKSTENKMEAVMSLSFRILKSLLISLVFLAGLLLTMSAAESRAEEPKDQENSLTVQILLYSGRPDPSYMITDKSDLDRLKELLTASPRIERLEGPVIPSILGYKGITVKNSGKIMGIPRLFAVYKGKIETRDEGIGYFKDTNNAIEKLLIELGTKKGVIDNKVVGEHLEHLR